MNNHKFRRFCEFRIKNILLSHKFLGTNRISCTIVILTVMGVGSGGQGGRGPPWTFKHDTNIVDRRLKSAIFRSFFAIFRSFFRCPPSPGKYSADTLAYCTSVQQILLKRSISSKRHHQFLLGFIWIRTYDVLRVKSMFLKKYAIQYNNSTTNSVVALNGAHLHVITPRQHLRRCWSGSEPFATLCKIWPAWDSNSRPRAVATNTVVQ